MGAQAFAGTILDLLLEPAHLDAVRAQFEEDAQDVTWTSLIPEGTIPPIELNADKMEKFRPLLAEFEYDLESGKTYIEQLGIDYPTVRDKR